MAPTSLLRAAAVRSAVAQNARMAPRYTRTAASHTAEAGHGSHAEDQEGFHGPFWRNTVLAVVLSFITYRVSLINAPASKPAQLEESHDPDAKPVEAEDKEAPYLTRYLAHHMPRQGLWAQNADKHLELSIKQAEDKLLLQDAQRPKIRRFRYPGTFEQASPHAIPVGAPVDMSDLTVRANLNAPPGESEE